MATTIQDQQPPPRHLTGGERPNPQVTLCCCDPHDPNRNLEVRGTVVEMTRAGAAEHLDQLASKGGRR